MEAPVLSAPFLPPLTQTNASHPRPAPCPPRGAKYLSDLLCETATRPRRASPSSDYVPESFESKKLAFFRGQPCVPGRERRHGTKKSTPASPRSRWKPGRRALLISLISRSTSYAVLSRMKTKRGERNFPAVAG